MTYKTSDLYFAAVLMSLGYVLNGIEDISEPKRKKLVLEYDHNHLIPDDMINHYYAHTIKVDAKGFVDSIKQIKSRIYQRQRS